MVVLVQDKLFGHLIVSKTENNIPFPEKEMYCLLSLSRGENSEINNFTISPPLEKEACLDLLVKKAREYLVIFEDTPLLAEIEEQIREAESFDADGHDFDCMFMVEYQDGLAFDMYVWGPSCYKVDDEFYERYYDLK